MTGRLFEFKNSKGLRLSARLERPDGEVRGWALFAHCFTCGKDGLTAVRVSRALAQAGIGVLRFDFAGLGDSEGEFADTTFASNVEDLVAAAHAMAGAGMSVDLVVGHSLGGAAAIAAADHLPTAKAFVTIGTPFDVAHVLQHFAPAQLAAIRREGEADVRLGGRVFHVRKAFVDDVETQSQGDRIGRLRRPLLVIHSPLDQVVGIDHATRIFVAAKHPKSFLSLDDADHLLTAKADAEHVGRVISSWAARYLRPIAETRSAGQPGDVTAEETRAGRFQVMVRAGGTRFLSDEPESVGGLGSGPTPFDLLSAALATCTTMTLRLYFEHKGWAVDRVRTAVGYRKIVGDERPDVFVRKIAVEGTLEPDQLSRVLQIADKCPVHQTLHRGARVVTQLGEPHADADGVDAHARSMAQVGS
jgi:putative redox protein